MVLFFFSFNNGTASEETKMADTRAATATSQANVKPQFIPFKIVAIQHRVKDFDKSVTGYFSRDSLLKSFGITHLLFGQAVTDPNLVFVVDKIEDVEKTKAFFKDPKVVESMKKAGVAKPPSYSFAEMVRYDDSPRKYAEGLLISHHVKDYDVWLKAFDAEGPAARAANGVIDRGIARDYYDPNTVYVLSDVSDMAKSKARVGSPELKKIMADAGVDTPPTSRWFKVVK
jgi:hypothetical protein